MYALAKDLLALLLRLFRWSGRPSLVVAGAAAREQRTGLPYTHVRVTPAVGNEGKQTARDWRLEISAPVRPGVRLGFPGAGFEKWGDQYVVRWEGDPLIENDRRPLPSFEVEIPASETLHGRYELRAPGARRARGDFIVDAEHVHFHADGRKHERACGCHDRSTAG